MGRSIKKGPFVDFHHWRRFRRPKTRNQNADQNMVAPLDDYTDFVGITFNVHNGKIFAPVSDWKTWSVIASGILSDTLFKNTALTCQS